MGKHEIGERVGAISHTKKGTAYFFGYGTYDGDEVPPPGIQIMGVELYEMELTNPKIILDSGDVVWGCECWWGSEESVRKNLLSFKHVVDVDVKEARVEINES